MSIATISNIRWNRQRLIAAGRTILQFDAYGEQLQAAMCQPSRTDKCTVCLTIVLLTMLICEQVSQVVGRGFASLFNSYASLPSSLEVRMYAVIYP